MVDVRSEDDTKDNRSTVGAELCCHNSLIFPMLFHRQRYWAQAWKYLPLATDSWIDCAHDLVVTVMEDRK